MRPTLLVLAALLAAQPLFAQSEFDNEDFDPYTSMNRSGSTGTGTGPANPYATYQNYGSYGPAQPGFQQTGSVQQGTVPWSGVWWPRKPCEMAFMSFSQGLSPLEKYDSLVYSNYGQIPGAAAWEADPENRHNEAAVNSTDWSGHCNGLAAAAILEPEPKRSIQVPLGQYGALLKLGYQHPGYAPQGLFRDGQNDYRTYRANVPYIELTVADQKALLCEMYMNVHTQQFENKDIQGTRYNSPNPDLRDPRYRDIYPHYFHYLLQTFVKGRGQAIVCEVDPGFPVNNHPLYAYETSSQFFPNQRKYAVTTTVYLTDYGRGYQDVGTNVMKQTFTYDLLLDQYGRIYWGEWTGSSQYNHPDFVWIPTQVAPANNGYSNPALNYQYAKYLLQQGR